MKSPFFLDAEVSGFGTYAADPGQIARADLRTAEVTPVSQYLQLRLAHRVLRRQSHPAELSVIASDIRHLMLDDQVMLRVHGGLNVVADRAGSLAARWSWNGNPGRSATAVRPVFSSTAS